MHLRSKHFTRAHAYINVHVDRSEFFGYFDGFSGFFCGRSNKRSCICVCSSLPFDALFRAIGPALFEVRLTAVCVLDVIDISFFVLEFFSVKFIVQQICTIVCVYGMSALSIAFALSLPLSISSAYE